jgi:hypothetical protein
MVCYFSRSFCSFCDSYVRFITFWLFCFHGATTIDPICWLLLPLLILFTSYGDLPVLRYIYGSIVGLGAIVDSTFWFDYIVVTICCSQPHAFVTILHLRCWVIDPFVVDSRWLRCWWRSPPLRSVDFICVYRYRCSHVYIVLQLIRFLLFVDLFGFVGF